MQDMYEPFLAGTPFGRALMDFSKQKCVHFDMALVAALPTLAERCNRRGMNVTYGGERQPLNLSHLIFAPRAKGKTQTKEFLTRKLQDEDDNALTAYDEQKRVPDGKLSAEERMTKKKKEAYALTHLVSDSPTMAALSTQLESQRSSLIFSDEGHIFLNALFEGRRDATQLFASLHDGTSYTEARLTRDDRRVRSPRVCTCLMLQPFYAREILTRQAVMGGLLSRFLIYACDSRPTVAERERPTRNVRRDWEACLSDLTKFLTELPECDVAPDDAGLKALRTLEKFEASFKCADDTRDLWEVACTRVRDKALRMGCLRALLYGRTEIAGDDVELSANLLLSAAEQARGAFPSGRNADEPSKREVMRAMFRRFPAAKEYNSREMARALGVSHSWVCKVKKEMEEEG